MTSERASQPGPTQGRIAGAALLVGALAVFAGAAHGVAQQGESLAPRRPVRAANDEPAPPKSFNPQPQKLPQGILDDNLPPAPKPPPRYVDPQPEPLPPRPTTQQTAAQTPTRPPAFRRIGASQPAEVRPPVQPRDRAEPPLVQPAAPTGSAVQTPALALDVVTLSQGRSGAAVYELVLRNVGATRAQHARLEDELPPGARLVGARPTPAVQGQRLVWEVADMPPGGEQRFRVEVMPQGGAVASRATVTVSATRTSHARPTVAARLAVTVAGPASVPLGHVGSFEVRATNLGGGALGRLSLAALLPSGLEHLFGTDIETAFDGLAPGETRRLPLELVAVQAGNHEIRVSAKADGQQANGRAGVTVTEDSVLGLRVVGPREALTETENEYRIEVTNRSPSSIRGVTLSESLPPGLDLIQAGRGSYDGAARAVRWQLGPLAPGETQAVTLRLLSRNTGPVLHRAIAQTDQGHEARLHQVLRFRVHGQAQRPVAASVKN